MTKRGRKAVLVAAACALSVSVPATIAHADTEPPAVDPKAGMMSTLNGYAEAYLDEDVDRALGYFSDRATTTVMGAQSTELAIGKPRIRQALEGAFAQLPPEKDPVEIRYGVLSIDSDRTGDTGWVTTFVYVAVPAEDGHGVDTVKIRHSSTFERGDDGRWRFVQFHNSVPVDGFPEPGDTTR